MARRCIRAVSGLEVVTEKSEKIDQLKSLKTFEADKQNSDNKDARSMHKKSLTTNIDRIQPPSISTLEKTAAHIIGPAPPNNPRPSVQRRQRRDDSDRNYNETVALNEEVNVLFGGNKKKIPAQ